MPVGPDPSMTAPNPVNWLKTVAGCPRLRFHPSKSNGPRTAQEYGLSAARQALKIVSGRARKPLAAGGIGLRLGQIKLANSG